MGYRLLLFDFDGTLVDTIGDIAHYVNEVLSDFGRPACSVEQVKHSIGFGVHELLKGVDPFFTRDHGRLEEAVALFKKQYREKPVLKTIMYPGVKEALTGPLGNVRKAIITNKPQDIALMILDELDLRRYFDLVIGMNGAHAPKPDPSSVFFSMRQFGIGPADTVYIGDSRIDGETSKNAGIDFGWVDYGYDEDSGMAPRFKFSSADEWKKLTC